MKLFKRILKRVAISTTVSFGLLAITSLDAIHQEKERDEGPRISAKRELGTRWIKPVKKVESASAATDLRRALENVELGATNPFAQLNDLRPLEAALDRGVKGFKKQSYRSPRFQEESGYDLVAFEITYQDHSTATIVASLERQLETGHLVPVVSIVTFFPDHADHVLYRGGQFTERQSVLPSVAQNLLAQRLNGGVPFLSVAR